LQPLWSTATTYKFKNWWTNLWEGSISPAWFTIKLVIKRTLAHWIIKGLIIAESDIGIVLTKGRINLGRYPADWLRLRLKDDWAWAIYLIEQHSWTLSRSASERLFGKHEEIQFGRS
jgi:hypothetical protein